MTAIFLKRPNSQCIRNDVNSEINKILLEKHDSSKGLFSVLALSERWTRAYVFSTGASTACSLRLLVPMIFVHLPSQHPFVIVTRNLP